MMSQVLSFTLSNTGGDKLSLKFKKFQENCRKMQGWMYLKFKKLSSKQVLIRKKTAADFSKGQIKIKNLLCQIIEVRNVMMELRR